MSKRSDREYILDMLDACNRILEYVKGVDYESFKNNREKQDAIIRNIEVLGEAVKNLSSNF